LPRRRPRPPNLCDRNLADGLLLGDWDAAEAKLIRAADADWLTDYEHLACWRALLAALRGDAGTAESVLTALTDVRASENPQHKSLMSLMEAFTAVARRQAQDALRHARTILTLTKAFGGPLGISHESML
jgi:hypothetical protein